VPDPLYGDTRAVGERGLVPIIVRHTTPDVLWCDPLVGPPGGQAGGSLVVLVLVVDFRRPLG
jgi:hypothetical protein